MKVVDFFTRVVHCGGLSVFMRVRIVVMCDSHVVMHICSQQSYVTDQRIINSITISNTYIFD